MIDYEKLKQAHELASQCESHYFVHIISHKDFELTLVNWLPDMPDLNFKDFDALIEKLKELIAKKQLSCSESIRKHHELEDDDCVHEFRNTTGLGRICAKCLIRLD